MSTGVTMLLLFVVSVVAVAALSPPRPLQCDVGQGLVLAKAFSQCVYTEITDRPIFGTLLGRQKTSMSDIREFVNDLCTEIIPDGISCVNGRFSECNPIARAQINSTMASGVGFICQPGGAGPEPIIMSILNSINDEDLDQAMDHGCPGETRDDQCRNRMNIAIGRFENKPTGAVTATFERAVKGYVQCWAGKYKEKKDTCPYWRADLMISTSIVLLYPLPGGRFPFTTQEAQDLFEL